MFDDAFRGYNIATILTLGPQYNEMMGFTQEEVEWLMRLFRTKVTVKRLS